MKSPQLAVIFAWMICWHSAISQFDVARLSFYENMNGVLANLISRADEANSSTIVSPTEDESVRMLIKRHDKNINVSIECASDEDCHKFDLKLSCAGADAFRNGHCFYPLKPSEHGCEYDDQCQKTCKESYCATDTRFRNEKGENQCRCQNGTYFLWKKCWRNCLPGTHPIRQNDDWSCEEHNPQLATTYLHRFKRQASRQLVC